MMDVGDVIFLSGVKQSEHELFLALHDQILSGFDDLSEVSVLESSV